MGECVNRIGKQWLSKYTITHSINVPIEAFEPHCRAKTSIIVLENRKPPPRHEIIGSICNTYGEDKHGTPRYKIENGSRTDELDDEMAQAAGLMWDPMAPVSELKFRFSQEDAIEMGVLVASFWWRDPVMESLRAFASEYDCDLVPVSELIRDGHIQVFGGHGSPSSHYKGKGDVPYVKVVDIKNWRVNENSSYFMPREIAEKYTKKRPLMPYDLLTPTTASKNIGLFGVVMPWQTEVILTREIFIWRMQDNDERIDRWLFLALVSLKVVHDQFKYLVLMQMNREDLGRRYRELVLPIPRALAAREKWAAPVRRYFEAQTAARASYNALASQLDASLFTDRP